MVFIGFLTVYIIAMYGLSNLLVYGSGPFNCLGKFRNLCNKHVPVVGEMLECMMCTSTNLGWMFSLFTMILFPKLSLTPYQILIGGGWEYWYLIIIMDALFTTGGVWLIHTFQEFLETLTNYHINNNNNEEEDEQLGN
jgi:hypothetical protein